MDDKYSKHLLKLKYNSQWNKLFFSILKMMYMPSVADSSRTAYKKVIFYVYRLLLILKYASIVWTLSTPISNWGNFQEIWKLIQYSRLDVICAELNSTETCVIFIFSFYSTVFFLIFFLALLVFSKKSIPPIFISLVRNL